MKYIIIFLILYCIGCDFPKTYPDISNLPTGVTNICNLNNGWITFDLEGKTFLYHRSTIGYRGFECITQIITKE